jgi:N-terminal acetyltransferase B complex non-catalytic subunit
MPKKEAAADEPVNARRLQPIYEALDARNYKQAIKLLTAAMEKHGQAHILLALLAVTYERTGRRDDALSTCAKVAAQRPSDEAVLSTLAHVYRAVDAPHAIVSLYEVASNSPAAQSSEDFLASMFVAYTRVGAHVKMQQTAMRLAKITKTDRYLAWAALNMAFQVFTLFFECVVV